MAQLANYTITATVTGNSTPTGAVSFYDYGTLVVGPVALADGQAQMSNSNFDFIGVHQITAKYSGDTSNQASTSSALSQTITGTIPISILASTGPDQHDISASVGIQ